nr:hypothetical protein [Pseudopedobacter sp.]
MKTKIIMTSSAIMLGSVSIIFSFLPDEVIGYLQFERTQNLVLVFQIIGALYFALAMLNVMSRNSVIGGIYNKPTSISNFAHFSIGSITLIKALFVNIHLPYIYWVVAFVYTVFAFAFGSIAFFHPAPKSA